MLRRLHRFVPELLKELDHHLLINRPVIWATRIHVLLFFVTVGLTLACFSTWWIDVSDVPDVGTRIAIMYLPVILGGGYWLWWVYHFQVHRRFGFLSRAARLQSQLIVMGGVILLLASPLIYGDALVESIDESVPTELFVRDMEDLHAGGKYFPTYNEDKLMVMIYLHREFERPQDIPGSTHYPQLRSETQEDTYTIDGVEVQFGEGDFNKRFIPPEIHIQSINRYKEVFEKYSGVTLAGAASFYLHSYKNNLEAYRLEPADFDQKLLPNLKKIVLAKNRSFTLYKQKSWVPILFGLLFLGLLFTIFIETEIRPFLLGLFMASVAVITSILVYLAFASFLKKFDIAYHLPTEGMAAIVLLVAILVGAWRGFHPSNGKFGSLFQKAYLTITCLSLSITGLLLGMAAETIFGYFSNFGWFKNILIGQSILLLLPVCTAILLWLVLFGPKLRQSSSAPDQR